MRESGGLSSGKSPRLKGVCVNVEMCVVCVDGWEVGICTFALMNVHRNVSHDLLMCCANVLLLL